jgi:hypothetical protein
MKDNNPEIIENDKSKYNHLYKEIQNKIKDKVITKYLSLIENQSKEITELKKENILLKNQLTYILKRILLHKNDYIAAARTNKLSNLNSSINYNRSMIIKDNNNRKSNSMMRPLKSCGNYRVVTDNFDPDKVQSRYKENNSLVNIHGVDNNNANNNVDNKISGYLNSLYRHNFSNSNKGGNDYFLNKNQTLYDELFHNKNNSYYLNSENDMELYGSNGKPKKRENLSAEKRGSFKKNVKGKLNDGRIKNVNNRSTGRRYKSKYTDLNNISAKKRIKENSYLEKGEKNKYHTINNTSQTQRNNKPKKTPLNIKRSPFLANKF